MNEPVRLHKCSVCGFIGSWADKDWSTYGSIAIEDYDTNLLPRVCGEDCMDEFQRRLDTKEVKLPKIRRTHGGYSADLKRGPVGYEEQPSQQDLWNEFRQKSEAVAAATSDVSSDPSDSECADQSERDL